METERTELEIRVFAGVRCSRCSSPLTNLNIPPINLHGALCGIVEALDQRHDGAFATAARADKSDRLPWLNGGGHAAEDRLVGKRGVRKMDVVQL